MREPKVGCTCKIWGDGDSRYEVVEVRREKSRDQRILGVILNTGCYEDIAKVYSIRYQPRPKSYYGR